MLLELTHTWPGPPPGACWRVEGEDDDEDVLAGAAGAAAGAEAGALELVLAGALDPALPLLELVDAYQACTPLWP